MMNDRRRITQSGGHNANRITSGIKRQLDLVYPTTTTTTTLSPTTTNMNNTSTTTVIPQQQQQQYHNNNNGHPTFQQPRPTFPLSNNNYTNNQQRATSFRSVNPQSSSSIYHNTYNTTNTNNNNNNNNSVNNNNTEKKTFRRVPVPNQTPVTTTRTTTNFPNNNNNNSNTTTNTNTNNNSNHSNTNNENTRRFTSVPIPSTTTTTTTTAVSHATTTNSNATTNMPRGYGSGRKAYFSATVPPSTTTATTSNSASPNKPLLPTSPTTATSPSTIHTNHNNNAAVTSGWNNVNRRAFVHQQTSPPNTMKTSSGGGAGAGATSTTTTRGQFTMAPPPQTNYPKPTFARKNNNNNNASPPYSKNVSPQQQQQQQRSSFTTPVRTFKPVISPTSSHIQAQNQQSPTIANHSHNTSSILISPSNNTSEFMEDSIMVNVGGANDTMEPISSFADLGFMTSGSKNESSDSNAAAAMEMKRMMEKLEEERHLLRSQLLDMQKQNEMIETKYKQERQTYESKLEYSNNENERLKKQEEETRRQFHEQLILEQKRIQELEQQQQQQKSSENEQYVEDMDLFDDFDLDAAQQRLNAQIAAQKEEPPVMNHRLESPFKNQQRAQAEPMEIDESTISLSNHSLSDSVILQTGRSSNLIPLVPRRDKYDETLYQLMFPLTQYSQKLFKKLFLKSSIRSIAPLVIEIMKSSIDNIHDESQIELNIVLIEAAVDVLLLFFSKNRDAFDCIESMIGAQLIDGLDEPIKTEETNEVPPQAIFKNPRIKLGSAWEPSMPSISNDCLLFKSNTVVDSKVVQPIIDFSHLVTGSPKEDVDIKLNTVDLLLDFIKVLIQDDTLQLPRHLLGRATRALELTFSALRALASVDSPNIINSFKKFVTQDYLFAFPLDDMNLWKSLLHIFPPLLKHKCIVATLLDNEENVFSFLSDNLGIVREDIEEHQLLQVQHQIVQLFIFIVCNCEDGYDILLGRKQKTSSNSSSNQISSRQRDIMIANAVVLLSRQLYELENQSESSTELSKCDKLRITLIQELIKFLSIYGTEILPSTRKMVHIVKGIKVNLMERKTREQNSYNHRTKFAFDANIISYL